MSNIIQSKFNLREQETTWYGASHHHEDLEELSEKPTLTENYKLYLITVKRKKEASQK